VAEHLLLREPMVARVADCPAQVAWSLPGRDSGVPFKRSTRVRRLSTPIRVGDRSGQWASPVDPQTYGRVRVLARRGLHSPGVSAGEPATPRSLCENEEATGRERQLRR